MNMFCDWNKIVLNLDELEEFGLRWIIWLVLLVESIVPYDSLPPPVSCEISDFIGYKNNLFGFHVWLQNQEKKLISTVIHLTRYIEVVLMRMVPHTFSHMEQNSTSISDSNWTIEKIIMNWWPHRCRHMAQN